MARPGGGRLSDAQFSKMVGLTEARKQVALLPDVIRAAAAPVLARRAAAIVADARAAIPVRESGSVPGYSGGALRKYFSFNINRKTLQAFLGIRKGAIATFKKSAVTIKPTEHVARYYWKDPWKGVKRKSKRYSRVLSRKGRGQLHASGGQLIQPSAYGHLVEFGTSSRVVKKTGKSSGSARSHPFAGPAVKSHRSAFESDMRGLSPDVVNALKQQGYKGGGL
jgi:hypothetical protein